MKYLKYFESLDEDYEELYDKISDGEYMDFLDTHQPVRIEEQTSRILELLKGRFVKQYNSYRGKDSYLIFTLPNRGDVHSRQIEIYYYTDEWFIVKTSSSSYRVSYESIYKCDTIDGLAEVFGKIL